tara:strand:+ start:283 stop:600 length:318 start_codon:yes stop_codon:yes gene_type:complete
MDGLDSAQNSYDRQEHPDYYSTAEEPDDKAARIEKEAAAKAADKTSEYFYLNSTNVIEAIGESSNVFGKRLAALLAAKDYESAGMAIEAQAKEYWTQYLVDLNTD